jgi:hypothetical protein
MTAARLTYWASGGDVVTAPGRCLSLAEANCRLSHHNHVGAVILATQLRQALDRAAAWRRAASVNYARAPAPNRLAKSARSLTFTGSASGTGTPRKSHSGSQPCEAL